MARHRLCHLDSNLLRLRFRHSPPIAGAVPHQRQIVIAIGIALAFGLVATHHAGAADAGTAQRGRHLQGRCGTR